MYRFIETIKLCHGKFYRIELHQKRLETVFAHFFPENNPFQIEELLCKFDFPTTGLFKCRILYSEIALNVTFEPYHLRSIQSLKLIVVESSLQNFKSENRAVIQSAFEKRENADDILMVVDGNITDTSYANVALLKANRWYTPEKPYLEGTQRSALLHEAQIHAMEIKAHDLHQFEKIRIFNALIEFGELELPISCIS